MVVSGGVVSAGAGDGARLLPPPPPPPQAAMTSVIRDGARSRLRSDFFRMSAPEDRLFAVLSGPARAYWNLKRNSCTELSLSLIVSLRQPVQPALVCQL